VSSVLSAQTVTFSRRHNLLVARFTAMAAPCEILCRIEHFDGADDGGRTEYLDTFAEMARCMAAEVWRIEAKWSRYREDSVIAALHRTAGKPFLLDDETRDLIHYAKLLYENSEGLFDITTGALRDIWHFHRKHQPNCLPDPKQIKAALALIGFDKLVLHGNELTLAPGMRLDLGGLGKEYAADSALRCLRLQGKALPPLLINLGGDLLASPSKDQPWQIGIRETSGRGKAPAVMSLTEGALTTSGTLERSWVFGGKRYSHLLDPRTGWPIRSPPTTVTVAAPHCLEAGALSTWICLQGEAAEAFAAAEAIPCWIYRQDT
jgi:FAD:protein FMN transferase